MWKTLTTSSGNVQINGVPFNPYWGNFTGITNTVADWGIFNLSGFQHGHEVVVWSWVWDESGAHHITFRQGATDLFFSTNTGFSSTYAYVGIDYDEIMTNGSDYYIDFWTITNDSNEWNYDYLNGTTSINFWTYSPIFYAAISVGNSISLMLYDWWPSGVTFRWPMTTTVTSKSGGNITVAATLPATLYPGYSVLCLWYKKTVQNTLNYTIANMPSVTEADSGYIWVEGANICFIDAVKVTRGYKHIIKHDWTIYSTWKTPWMMWVGTTNHGKICYIDSWWNERKTHTGNIHGSPWNSEQTISWKTPWMMWVSGNSGNYAYLTFIGYDGNGYRIMNGEV